MRTARSGKPGKRAAIAGQPGSVPASVANTARRPMRSAATVGPAVEWAQSIAVSADSVHRLVHHAEVRMNRPAGRQVEGGAARNYRGCLFPAWDTPILLTCIKRENQRRRRSKYLPA
jgi:hypothetical protein